MSNYFTPAQLGKLLEPINPGRVGKDGKGFSHVEAYEIRAHLNRIFGFARWSADLLDLTEVFATEKDGKWTVLYRATVRLTVCAPDGTVLATYTEAATGEAKNQPHRGDAHDLAMKTAESQAMKRCAANLGDQFGLSLYRKGSVQGLVRLSLVGGSATPVPVTEIDAHVTESVPESEQVEDKRETSTVATPPPPPPADDARAKAVEVWRKKLLAGPANNKAPAPFYARMFTEAKDFLTALVEDREGNVVSVTALLNQEQTRTRRAS